jgi:hypothetical protein
MFCSACRTTTSMLSFERVSLLFRKLPFLVLF